MVNPRSHDNRIVTSLEEANYELAEHLKRLQGNNGRPNFNRSPNDILNSAMSDIPLEANAVIVEAERSLGETFPNTIKQQTNRMSDYLKDTHQEGKPINLLLPLPFESAGSSLADSVQMFQGMEDIPPHIMLNLGLTEPHYCALLPEEVASIRFAHVHSINMTGLVSIDEGVLNFRMPPPHAVRYAWSVGINNVNLNSVPGDWRKREEIINIGTSVYAGRPNTKFWQESSPGERKQSFSGYAIRIINGEPVLYEFPITKVPRQLRLASDSGNGSCALAAYAIAKERRGTQITRTNNRIIRRLQEVLYGPNR